MCASVANVSEHVNNGGWLHDRTKASRQQECICRLELCHAWKEGSNFIEIDDGIRRAQNLSARRTDAGTTDAVPPIEEGRHKLTSLSGTDAPQPRMHTARTVSRSAEVPNIAIIVIRSLCIVEQPVQLPFFVQYCTRMTPRLNHQCQMVPLSNGWTRQPLWLRVSNS
jgi:hypothetical protein